MKFETLPIVVPIIFVAGEVSEIKTLHHTMLSHISIYRRIHISHMHV